MSYAVLPFSTFTNEDFDDGFLLQDDDGPIDLTGSEFIVHIRQSVDNLAMVLEASTENGLLILADQAVADEMGLVEFSIPAQTAALVAPGSYPYDILWIMPGGGRANVGGGTITFNRGVTRIT